MDIKTQQFINSLFINELITQDLLIQITEAIPDEEFALTDLATWLSDQGVCTEMEIMHNIIMQIENQHTDNESTNTNFEFPAINSISSKTDAEVQELIKDMLQATANLGASDLHISAASQPFIRQNLKIKKIGEYIIKKEDSYRINTALLSLEQKEEFDKKHDLDYAMAINEKLRIRVNLMIHKDGVEATYRIIPNKVKTLGELGFSPRNIETITRMLDNHNGLILVTGPINSGKTTTLASLVGMLNEKRFEHIITMEEPLEIIQKSGNCNIMQREIGTHTKSYATALKASLREDPDVIVLGELRDLETIEMAITASETGHLVIGTLHTGDASSTLNRMLDVFPPSQQAQIRTMLAGSLRGIICQKLVEDIEGELTVASEVLVSTSAVVNLIADGKTHQLPAVMQTGTKQGMCTMDQSIYDLYKAGKISYDAAMGMIKDNYLKKQIDTEIAEAQAAEEEARLEAEGGKKKKGWFK